MSPAVRVRPRAVVAASLVVALVVAMLVAGGARPAVADTGDHDIDAEHSLRSPVTDETFYFVMADRFENGNPGNDTAGLGDDPDVSGFDPTSKAFFNGGDLEGLLERIDYIEGLGTTSIWLTPSFKNKPVQPEDRSAGYHGYWVTDFTQIDPHLGTNEELRALVDEAHGRGMKVYFDIITNHTADVISYPGQARQPYISKDEAPYRTATGEVFDDRDYAGTDNFPTLDPATSFPYYPALQEGEEDLKVPGWLNDVTLYHNRGDTTFTGEDSLYGDFVGLDDLFTEHPRVVEGMIDIYKTWIADFGIDGFRIDTMRHVNDEFWQQFGPEVLDFAREQGKDEFFMFGEVAHTSKPYLSRFTTVNEMQSTLDFAFQEAARNFASRSAAATDLGNFFIADDWFTDADSNAYQLPTFLGNHDMGRIGSFVMADNPEADEEELLARDELAHELMYFSRGNPVVYYGDEQGFTGEGGDQDARQSMFASEVEAYLEDELLGTDATHAQDNFDPSHRLYEKIAELAELTRKHPALRDGAHQHRYASDGPGIYAFSRVKREHQREYVVALNNSEQEQTAAVPTFVDERLFGLVYGDGARRLRSAQNGTLEVTVPPLSAVVYASIGRIAQSQAAPSITLGEPSPTEAQRSRMQVTAEVDGDSFYEVTFQAAVADGEWQSIGTDDNAPYQVFHDVEHLATGTPLRYRAVVLDNAGHTAVSDVREASVPAPVVTIEAPAEGGLVNGIAEVRAVVDPERASHVVELQRSVDGGDWTSIEIDSSSPVYTAFDDLTWMGLADGTPISYRAILMEDGGGTITSEVRTVTVGEEEVVQPDAVSIPGNFNTEMGCAADWLADCEQAQLTLDPEDGLWKGTFELPEGPYQYKVALNRAWDVQYGARGVRNGSNIWLEVEPDQSTVTFVWDPATRLVTTTAS